MRVHAPLDDLISGKTSVRVLRTLALFPDKEFTGRELAQLAGGAPSRVITELDRLRVAGLVTRRTLGRTHSWKVNPKHEAFRLLAPVFEREHALPRELDAQIARGVADERIARAIVFGSFGRGDENATSDVDLLVLAKRAADVEPVRDILDKLSIRLVERFGLRLSAIVHAQADLPRLQRTALFANVRADGRALKGDPL